VLEVADACGDRDLRALGMLSSGQAALVAGAVRRGMALLDETMVAVAAGEVSPVPAGIVYCAVVDACIEVFDLRRAAEWTEALDRWSGAQPDLVPYRGQCLVHRSQLLQAHGSWPEARTEADRACRWLSRPSHPALGLALYQRAELHRLRGELADAERSYRAASRQGCEPAPGLALLRLAEGRVDAAVAAIRRVIDETRGPLRRPALLAAGVEILLAAGAVDDARSAAGELHELAGEVDAPLLHAVAAFATGSVLLAGDDPVAALGALRDAHERWRELDMPYDAARARVRIGLACRQLGDDDAALLELDAARLVFAQLEARPALAEVTRLTAAAPPSEPRPGGLTGRECEVLRHVAAGETDREIAAALVISEHTVGRHLQNIFRKLGLSSRAAATSFAHEHHLV
jgi:DNA-binding CsgD family transcriptional regulator